MEQSDCQKVQVKKQLLKFQGASENKSVHSRLSERAELEILRYETSLNTDYETKNLKNIKRHSISQVILAWLSLFFAIISLSSIGPMFKFLDEHGVMPIQAASWRCQCMSIFLAPLALFEYYVTKSDKQVSWFTNRTDLPLPLIVHVIAAGLCWTGNLVFWVVSLKYISTVVASLLNSIQPLILAMYLCLCGKMISKYEWIGVIIAILGIFIASFNNLIATPGTMASNALIGIPFAFAAAVCDVMMVLTRRHQKKYVPLFQYTLVTTIVVAISCGVLAVLFEGSSVFGTCDRCVFGWMSDTWRFTMLMFGMFIGVFCNTGFNFAVQFIDPLVFSSVQLVDPILVGLISWRCGLEPPPILLVWLGGGTIIFGILLLTYGEHDRNRHESSMSEYNSIELSQKNREKEILIANETSLTEKHQPDSHCANSVIHSESERDSLLANISIPTGYNSL